MPLLAGSGDRRTCSSLFRKTSTRPLLARYSRSTSRPRALPRLLQMSVSASTTMDHSNIPNHRRVIGTTPVIEGCPAMQANRRRYAGSGVEKPNLDALHRDCSRRGLCPNPDRFRHLLSRACLCFPVRSDVGREACRRRDARLHGRRGERVVRRRPPAKEDWRSPTRGAFRRGAIRLRGLGCSSGGQSHRLPCLRFFHHREDPCEGRSPGL